MGPDAWPGDEWDEAGLAEMLRGRRAPLKAVLLDQRHLAGIGNIYADEILFAAGLSPLRPAGSLDADETAALAAEIRRTLAEGVRLRGCSISDYVDAAGRRWRLPTRSCGRTGGRGRSACAAGARWCARSSRVGHGVLPSCQR